MDEIIVIRVADSDGSLFEAIIDALKNKRAEVIHVAAPFSSVLRVGDLEIYLDQQRVLMSGREVRLNHGEYAMLMHMVKSPGQVFSKRQLYAAAWDKEYWCNSTSVENTICRLRKKLKAESGCGEYIKTVVGLGYKIEIPQG